MNIIMYHSKIVKPIGVDRVSVGPDLGPKCSADDRLAACKELKS